MKKALVVSILFTVAFFLSCAGIAPPVDRGVQNPAGVPETDLVVLNIHEFINIMAIDDQKILWSKPFQGIRAQVVKVPEGVHVFKVRYNTGHVRSMAEIPVIAKLEKGKEYRIEGFEIGMRVDIQVIDVATNENVVLETDKLKGNDSSALTAYIKYVLNPTMEGVDKTVKLENDDAIFLFKPDLVYTMTDKKTGKTTEGKRGFAMDFKMSAGKTYLLETDITKMTTKQFLDDSGYEETAQTVMVPVFCDATKVRYKIVKPESANGIELEYSIEVLN